MKSLTLLRHAKSSSDDPGLSDFDRPLNARGVAAATAIGRHLHAHRVQFDTVLVSAARRTVETWTLLAAELEHPPAPTVERTLYLCGRRALLTRIRALPEDAASVLVVAHNPDLHEIASALAADGDPVELARMHQHFPTGAMAVLRFDGAWSKLAEASLDSYVVPRELEET
ncbi:SixA phosphatase family protein [Roseiterribacter gracilis]|uniref:Phosphoglycerate mutase n=1 Tax=Roseiterribacter gracilis TaxID=2812848 RepID=A0A8S8XDY1_9PROT|nr:phosphoglycerate mutase [Rhodospirillales bacterium TMPK1]